MTNAAAEEDEVVLRHYVGVLWRRKVIVVAVAALVVCGALVAISRQTSSFRSTSQVLLQSRPSEQIFSPDDTQTGSGPGSTGAVGTEIAIMGSQSMREAVQEKVGGRVSVSFAAIEGTQVVAITAETRSRLQAPVVAQAYAETYVKIRREQVISDLLSAIEIVQAEVSALDTELATFDQPLSDIDTQLATAIDDGKIRSLESQRQDLIAKRQPLLSRRATFEEEVDQLRLASNLTKTGGAQVISAASGPRKANIGQDRRNLVAALGLGILLGIVLAFVREHFDESVKNRDGLEAATATTPLLALIPRFPRQLDRKPNVILRLSPRSPAAEAYRGLRASFEVLTRNRSARLVLVTSPSPGDGKTVTLANLGVALARAGHRVLLVDCNFRRPRLHRYFGLGNEVGVTSVLLDGRATTAQKVPGEPNLQVLTSGPTPPAAFEVLATAKTKQFLSTLKAKADFVLIDGPALLPVADSIALAGAVDAVVLLARAHRTSRTALERGVELLGQVGVPVIGTVLNATEPRAAMLSGFRDRRSGESDREAGDRRLSAFRRTRKDHSNGKDEGAAAEDVGAREISG